MRALCVFSGGLDSMLAAELIRAQGIDVQAFFFETPFFSSQRARKSAHHMDLPFNVVDITKRHLEVIRNPRHGYGGNMNPCIDCHTLMFRIAGEMLETEGASFVLTGEVLGQRPMSQNKQSLNLTAIESGIQDLLLRPLSAKNLPLTIPEEKGWVNRDKLMNFQGRSRKPQIELARLLNIKEYPSPGGGCLLTEKAFSQRLRDLIDSKNSLDLKEIELLKLGRHFRIGSHTKAVVGRNKEENQAILALAEDKDLVLTSTAVPGPTTVVLGDCSKKSLALATAITVAYSDTEGSEATPIRIMGKTGEEILMAKVCNKEKFRRYMI
jgi:tRNA-specific 2-thiouridylase